mgnify:CR=1 FL=1
MKILNLLVVIVLSGTCLGGEQDVVKHLQDISVTVRCSGSEGSGVIKNRTIKNGDKEEVVSYILSAAHVVSGARKTRTVVDSKTGQNKTLIEFADADIVQILIENDRKVGEYKLSAEVLRYSDSEFGEDLALLRLRKRNFVNKNTSVRFYNEDKLPPVGENLYHLGSFLGTIGANSLASGIISAHGRVLPNGKVFSQSSAVAFPGSSGAGMYLKDDGRYIGMLVRGHESNFNYYIPMPRIKNWAKRTGVEFILDDNIEVPSDKELFKSPIEDDISDSVKTENSKAMPGFLIKKIEAEQE